MVVCTKLLEEANFVENAAPGALYADTWLCYTTGECDNYKECEDDKKRAVCIECDADNECADCAECSDYKKCLAIDTPCENVKVFEIALVQAKLTYNQYGWHDPEGRFFVLKEELERHGGLESYICKVEAQ